MSAGDAVLTNAACRGGEFVVRGNKRIGLQLGQDDVLDLVDVRQFSLAASRKRGLRVIGRREPDRRPRISSRILRPARSSISPRWHRLVDEGQGLRAQQRGAVRLCSAGMVAPPTARSMATCASMTKVSYQHFRMGRQEFPVVSPGHTRPASRSWQVVSCWMVSNDRRVCKASTALRVMLSRCRIGARAGRR